MHLFLLVSHTTHYMITAAHDTIRGTAHHHRTHLCIDEGIPQKLNLLTEAQQFHHNFKDT
jgi:hypothetical protein